LLTERRVVTGLENDPPALCKRQVLKAREYCHEEARERHGSTRFGALGARAVMCPKEIATPKLLLRKSVNLVSQRRSALLPCAASDSSASHGP